MSQWAPRRLYLSEVPWSLPAAWYPKMARLVPGVMADSALQIWLVAQNAWRPIEAAGLGPTVTYFGIAALAGGAGISYSCGIYYGQMIGRTSLAQEVASLGYVEPSKLQELALELALPRYCFSLTVPSDNMPPRAQATLFVLTGACFTAAALALAS